MSKILELADAYARETYPALITEARAALAAEVEKLEAEVDKLEAAFNDRVRVIEMQLNDKDALRAELEAARKQMESQKDEWLKWEAKRTALEKDADRYRWLRVNSCWTKGGLVVTSVKNVQLGAMCPTDTTLDQTIDAAMEATK